MVKIGKVYDIGRVHITIHRIASARVDMVALLINQGFTASVCDSMYRVIRPTIVPTRPHWVNSWITFVGNVVRFVAISEINFGNARYRTPSPFSGRNLKSAAVGG